MFVKTIKIKKKTKTKKNKKNNHINFSSANSKLTVVSINCEQTLHLMEKDWDARVSYSLLSTNL